MTKKNKPRAKVTDLEAKKDPKGGGITLSYAKIEQTYTSQPAGGTTTTTTTTTTTNK